MNSFISSLRRKVAREAAILLYTLQEREFKQAKERAAKNLGLRILPTNLEVAEELDRIAEEYEGDFRRKRLIRMRREALEIMEVLKEFQPRLIGSVWRGTANKNSDIDIIVFSQNSELVTNTLENKGFKIVDIEKIPVIKGEAIEVLHVFINLPSGDKAEIIIRKQEDIIREERCEIYGDLKRGLNIEQLKKVLKRNPLQKFIPKRSGKM